jgi:SAM-dependent methyltransferase
MNNTNSTKRNFDPAIYWENRLRANPNLVGTGHRRFSEAYNQAMYQIAADRIHRAITTAGIDLTGSRVLDIGPGFGYFVQRYFDWGCSHLTGWDITQTSIDHLSRTYTNGTFAKLDISDPDIPVTADYDLVSAISVVYHIVDENRFKTALSNMCKQVKPGGYMLVVDAFQRPRLPDSQHVRMRNMAHYKPILDAKQQIISTSPLYYVMSRSILPIIGPKLLSTPLAIRMSLKLERLLESRVRSNASWLSIMITQRRAS